MSKLYDFLIALPDFTSEQRLYVQPVNPADSYHLSPAGVAAVGTHQYLDWVLVGTIASLGIKPMDVHAARYEYFYYFHKGNRANHGIALCKVGELAIDGCKSRSINTSVDQIIRSNLATQVEKVVAKIVADHLVVAAGTIA